MWRKQLSTAPQPNGWDLIAEGRTNRFVEIGVNKYGANVGVYRHFGNPLKAGVGYSWSKVSDDLRTIKKERKVVYLTLWANSDPIVTQK